MSVIKGHIPYNWESACHKALEALLFYLSKKIEITRFWSSGSPWFVIPLWIALEEMTCNTQRKYRLQTPSSDYSPLHDKQYRLAHFFLSLGCIYVCQTVLFAWNFFKSKMNICFTSGIVNLQLRFMFLHLGSITR